MKPLKLLSVDFDHIQYSMRDLSRENNEFYFNRATGKVLPLSRTLIRFLVLEEKKQAISLPDWEARMIPLARQIVVKGNPDYIRIPEAFGCPEHAWMKEFAHEINVFKIKQKVLSALRCRGACRQFKDALREHPEDWKKWLQFRSNRWKEKVQAWLETFGILAVDSQPQKTKSVGH